MMYSKFYEVYGFLFGVRAYTKCLAMFAVRVYTVFCEGHVTYLVYARTPNVSHCFVYARTPSFELSCIPD